MKTLPQFIFSEDWCKDLEYVHIDDHYHYSYSKSFYNEFLFFFKGYGFLSQYQTHDGNYDFSIRKWKYPHDMMVKVL